MGILRGEGWRRRGGAFTLGPVIWEQCENSSIVLLEVTQDNKIEKLPACKKCWLETIKKNIEIKSCIPLDDFDTPS